MTHTVSHANAEAPRSHSSFGAPAAASASPRGRQAWCLVMVLMEPDFPFVMCLRAGNAQGRTGAKAVAIALDTRPSLDAEAISTRTAGEDVATFRQSRRLVRRNVFRSDEVTALPLRREHPAPNFENSASSRAPPICLRPRRRAPGLA